MLEKRNLLVSSRAKEMDLRRTMSQRIGELRLRNESLEEQIEGIASLKSQVQSQQEEIELLSPRNRKTLG